MRSATEVSVSVLSEENEAALQFAETHTQKARLNRQAVSESWRNGRTKERTRTPHFRRHRLARTSSKPQGSYPCGKCQKIYSNASSLYRHLKLECGVLPQFHCPYCRFSSKRKFNLNSHVIHKHSKALNCYVNVNVNE